jgi:outer membrane protein
MNKTRVVSVLLLLAAMPFSVPAADLLQVYQAAVQKDPQFKAAEAGHQAALMNKPLARDLYFPNASIGASANRTDSSRAGGSTDYNSTAYSLSLDQPIFNYSYIVQNRQAEATVGRANSELGAAQQDLIVRSATRYFAVLAALDNLQFTRAQMDAFGRQLEQAQKRFEVGMIAITDVQQAKAAYDSAVAENIDAENLVENAREALREITGQYYEQLVPLGDKMPLLTPEPADPDKWTQVALEQNLQLRAAKFSSEEAKQTIDLQRAGRYPTVDAQASYGRQYRGALVLGDQALPGFATKDTVYGLQLTFPFYQGGSVSDRTKQAAYQYEQSKETLEQQRRATIRQAEDAYRGVISGISQVKALEQAVVSNKSALDATEAGFDVGTRTIVVVLVSQRSLIDAQRNYAKSRYTYILNTLSLKQAAGVLSPQDLQQINAWLK